MTTEGAFSAAETAPPPLVVLDPVRAAEVRYWMHYAAHVLEDPVERQAARRSEESLLRLVRQRDRIRALRRAVRVNGLTGKADPTTADQEDLFDATQTFFENYYGALSDFAALVSRTWRMVDPGATPPRTSMRKFLGWFAEFAVDLGAADPTPALHAARDFRTVLDHAGLGVPFDWGTHAPHRFTHVRLFGPVSASGNIPDGATLGGFPWEGWHFTAPDEVATAEALVTCARIVMPLLFGAAWAAGAILEDPSTEEPVPATFYAPALTSGEVEGWHVRVKPPIASSSAP